MDGPGGGLSGPLSLGFFLTSFWNTLAQEVTAYVKSCLLCQKRKSVCSLTSLPTGMLQSIKVDRPFQKIGVDLLGPFPTSLKGNKMIIVAVDYLTKWVELQADVVTQFSSIKTDRGKFFLADLTQNVWKNIGY